MPPIHFFTPSGIYLSCSLIMSLLCHELHRAPVTCSVLSVSSGDQAGLFALWSLPILQHDALCPFSTVFHTLAHSILSIPPILPSHQVSRWCPCHFLGLISPFSFFISVWIIPRESLKLSSVTYILWIAFFGFFIIGLMPFLRVPGALTAPSIHHQSTIHLFICFCVCLSLLSLYFLICNGDNSSTYL